MRYVLLHSPRNAHVIPILQVPSAVSEWVAGLGEGRNWAWRFMTALISGEADNVLSSVGNFVQRSGKSGERLWLVRLIFVQRLALRSQKEWEILSQNGKIPATIPSRPDLIYCGRKS